MVKAEDAKNAEAMKKSYQLALAMESFHIHIHENFWTEVDEVTSHELPVNYTRERQNRWTMTLLPSSTGHLTTFTLMQKFAYFRPISQCSTQYSHPSHRVSPGHGSLSSGSGRVTGHPVPTLLQYIQPF